mmetsp:Transcript_16255/g.27491  ORF Transcript_16255/g.27491 Transcript_16255/m.27491 type:complete len:236 (+) Transcript_16255:583-1290(+)
MSKPPDSRPQDQSDEVRELKIDNRSQDSSLQSLDQVQEAREDERGPPAPNHDLTTPFRSLLLQENESSGASKVQKKTPELNQADCQEPPSNHEGEEQAAQKAQRLLEHLQGSQQKVKIKMVHRKSKKGEVRGSNVSSLSVGLVPQAKRLGLSSNGGNPDISQASSNPQMARREPSVARILMGHSDSFKEMSWAGEREEKAKLENEERGVKMSIDTCLMEEVDSSLLEMHPRDLQL